MDTVIMQGDTFIKQVNLQYEGNKTPVNLTGFSAYCQLRKYPGEVLEAEATATIIPKEGCVRICFSAAQTANLEPGEYGYDVRIESTRVRKTIYSERVTVAKPYTDRE